MPQVSAGLVLYRRVRGEIEIFLVHPGGPFWAGKDEGAWSIPKGLVEAGEDALVAAKREFAEETGLAVSGLFEPLGQFRQPSGKIVTAWSVEADVDPLSIVSNSFSMEWPPRSGRMEQFPDVDRAGWFAIDAAMSKILKGQVPIVRALRARLELPRARD